MKNGISSCCAKGKVEIVDCIVVVMRKEGHANRSGWQNLHWNPSYKTPLNQGHLTNQDVCISPRVSISERFH